MRPGDIVRLKSGGPQMTVDIVTKQDDGEPADVQCLWFNKQYGTFEYQLKAEGFCEDVLMLVKGSADPALQEVDA